MTILFVELLSEFALLDLLSGKIVGVSVLELMVLGDGASDGIAESGSNFL
jgi:hypothetical protein